MTKSGKLIGAGFVLAGAISFSAKAVFIKLAYQYPVDAISLLTLRMLFSLPFFVGVAIHSEFQPDTTRLSAKDFFLMFIMAAIGYYLASIFDFEGLLYISAGMERLILFVYPTLVVLISLIFYKIKVSKIQWGALALTYLGIFIVFHNSADLSGQKDLIKGGSMVFVAALTYAIYLVGSGKLIPRIGPRRYTAYVMSFASLIVFAHFLFTHSLEHLFSLDHDVYFWSIFIALLSTVISSFLISEGLHRIGPNNTSIIAGIGPVATIFLAWILLGERIDFFQGLGTLFVLTGVVLVSLKQS